MQRSFVLLCAISLLSAATACRRTQISTAAPIASSQPTATPQPQPSACVVENVSRQALLQRTPTPTR